MTELLLGKRLKSLITERGLTQEHVAWDNDFDSYTMSSYIHGRRIPRIQMVIKLAKYFNVTTDYLLGLSDVKQRAGDTSHDT